VPIEQTWQLAKAWYAGRLEHGWMPRTARESEEVFASVGLTDSFWRLT